MSSYLNSKKASLLYKDETLATYFVDKTAMLDELIYLYYQAPPLWQIHDSQYNRSLSGERQEHPPDLRPSGCKLPQMVPCAY